MEWTGRQQLLFLLQSAGLGFLIGLVFELVTGLGRGVHRRWQVFLLDAVFGAIAALVTFYGALAIMDGQLHPLLFAGVLVGFLAEHGSVGRWISRAIFRCRRCFCCMSCYLLDAGERFLGRITAAFSKKRRSRRAAEDSAEKKRKKSRFFAKNT